MLSNEKYMGDALLQKTFVTDVFSHRSEKNLGQLPQYYVHDCHPPIIDRETFGRYRKRWRGGQVFRGNRIKPKLSLQSTAANMRSAKGLSVGTAADFNAASSGLGRLKRKLSGAA